ncbi:hypothetical protein BKA83DRAFT_90391 [Pisolithus microcarpus]|nr:hypothetical protein BKA83DRAFT_90391 [Pisolithus microcarpus]
MTKVSFSSQGLILSYSLQAHDLILNGSLTTARSFQNDPTLGHFFEALYIHTAPMWRQEGPHYDYAFVIMDPELEGMCGMDTACVLCFFSFKAGSIFYPCAIMRWFDHLGEAPDELTRMWMVHPSFTSNHQCKPRSHLIPIYGQDCVLQEILPCHSYDTFYGFYVNKFADHHTFEIVY